MVEPVQFLKWQVLSKKISNYPRAIGSKKVTFLPKKDFSGALDPRAASIFGRRRGRPSIYAVCRLFDYIIKIKERENEREWGENGE